MVDAPNTAPETLEISSVSAEGGTGLETMALPNAIEKISEVLPENQNSSAQAQDDTATSSIGFASIRDSIVGVFSPRYSDTIPAPEVQRTRIKKSLQSRIKKLEQKAARLSFSRNMAASRMEEIVRQIRYYKSLIAEIVTLASEALERLYREYVLGQQTV